MRLFRLKMLHTLNFFSILSHSRQRIKSVHSVRYYIQNCFLPCSLSKRRVVFCLHQYSHKLFVTFYELNA